MNGYAHQEKKINKISKLIITKLWYIHYIYYNLHHHSTTQVNFISKPLQKLIGFLDNFGPPLSLFLSSFFFLSFLNFLLFFLYPKFPLSSSAHGQLFNFLLLLGDDEDDDDESLDLILARVVTRSCGNVFGGFLRLLSITNSCIKR